MSLTGETVPLSGPADLMDVRNDLTKKPPIIGGFPAVLAFAFSALLS